jgi:hypothetical protein
MPLITKGDPWLSLQLERPFDVQTQASVDMSYRGTVGGWQRKLTDRLTGTGTFKFSGLDRLPAWFPADFGQGHEAGLKFRRFLN